MKLISLFLFLLLLFTCGIGDALGGIDIPQRYIERQVNHTELVGTWNLTTDSENNIQSYDLSSDIPHHPNPWKSITLNDDGTCHVDFESSWNTWGDDLGKPSTLAACTWKLDTLTGYDKDLSPKAVPGVSVRFEYFVASTNSYEVYDFDSYIAEENNQLILWNFVGDITDSAVGFIFQDFKKAGK